MILCNVWPIKFVYPIKAPRLSKPRYQAKMHCGAFMDFGKNRLCGLYGKIAYGDFMGCNLFLKVRDRLNGPWGFYSMDSLSGPDV